jgi:hypothetical protein
MKFFDCNKHKKLITFQLYVCKIFNNLNHNLQLLHWIVSFKRNSNNKYVENSLLISIVIHFVTNDDNLFCLETSPYANK